MATKHTDETPKAPILSWLNIRSGGSVSADLVKLAAQGRLADLEAELSTLRKAVAKATGGPAGLRLKLADAERKAETVGEPELRREYQRRASDLRKQIADG